MTVNLSNLVFVLWSLVFCFLEDVQYTHTSFTEVSDQVLGGPLNGLIATFGDFNMDKRTDVFVITDNGHKAELYMKDEDGSYLLNLYPPATIERLEDTITSIAAGDFDGDFQMDILITTKPNTDPFNESMPTKAFVYWGNVSTLRFENWTLVTDQLADQPLVMDYNADMIPDLFGEVMSGQKKFWTRRRENDTRTFIEVNLLDRHDYHLVVPNSNAFLDVTGNYAANLIMATTKLGMMNTTFEVWSYLHVEGTEESHNAWRFTKEYAPPSGVAIEHLGVSTFADMDADGQMDHILPVCHNANCSKGGIYVKFQESNEWTAMFDLAELNSDGQRWGFVPPMTHLTDYTILPLVVRTGDYNLDTLTDLLVLVQASIKGMIQRKIVVLKNTGDHLEEAWSTDLAGNIPSPIMATFIDIQRTGQLDILVANQSDSGAAQILLLDNILTVDAYFVKIEVLSGLCSRSCPGGGSSNIPYGVNPPGPAVRYATTGSTGQPQRDGGSQLSQSAYFALQVPYVLLGLGQNPNFVDTLKVGVPSATNPEGKNSRVDEWTSIIPNSQLIIAPYPLDKPDEWLSKILIIPGQSVLLTGVVLICTCIVLALTAALLHLKERKDDEKEKRQEAHRFHFDAM